jgi:hypothetical protein
LVLVESTTPHQSRSGQIHGNNRARVEAQIRIRVDDVDKVVVAIGCNSSRKENSIGRGCNTALAEIAPATNRHHKENKKRGSGMEGRSLQSPAAVPSGKARRH